MILLQILAGIGHMILESVPDTYAQTVDSAAAAVGSTFGFQATSFLGIITAVVRSIRPLIFVGGIFIITLSGFRMVITEEEESFNKAQRIISATVTGIMLAFLVEPFVDAFYGDGSIWGVIGIGTVPQGNAAAGAAVLSAEILGLIDWFLTLVAIVAVFIIIISGVKAMSQAGSEEGLTQLRRTVFSVISGILLIAFRVAINQTLGLPTISGATGTADAAPAIAAVIRLLNYLLGFIAIVGLAMLTYAGMQMILNFGDEEMFKKARGLAFRVGIGILVIAISLALINIVVSVG